MFLYRLHSNFIFFFFILFSHDYFIDKIYIFFTLFFFSLINFLCNQYIPSSIILTLTLFCFYYPPSFFFIFFNHFFYFHSQSSLFYLFKLFAFHSHFPLPFPLFTTRFRRDSYTISGGIQLTLHSSFEFLVHDVLRSSNAILNCLKILSCRFDRLRRVLFPTREREKSTGIRSRESQNVFKLDFFFSTFLFQPDIEYDQEKMYIEKSILS